MMIIYQLLMLVIYHLRESSIIPWLISGARSCLKMYGPEAIS